MQIGLEQIRSIRRMERAKHRKKVLLTMIVLLVLSMLYLCLRGREMGFMNPGEVLTILFTDLRIRVSSLWGGAYAQNREEILKAHPYYSETVIRFACTGSEPWENKPLIKGDYRCSRVLTRW